MFELLLLIFFIWLLVKIFSKIVDVPVKAATKLVETTDDFGQITKQDIALIDARIKAQPHRPVKEVVNEYLREKALVKELSGKSVVVVSEDELFDEKV